MTAPSLIVRHLPILDYHLVWRTMRDMVDRPDVWDSDEIWFLQHPPVFTLGQAGRREHLRDPGDIPVVASDRGGQVTYHGPGQLVVYLLVDLKRRSLGVKRLVHGLEQAVIDLLAASQLGGDRLAGAPGVYVGGKKLAAIGLRIRNGRSFHGLAVNVDGDLAPFKRIDPCGFANLQVTCLKDLGLSWSLADTATKLLPYLAAQLGYPSGSTALVWESSLPEIAALSARAIPRGLAGAGG